MAKRKSRAPHHQYHAKALAAGVMSPRIAWLEFLKFLKTTFKVSFLILALGGAIYGITHVVRLTLYENPDFQLREIRLNSNDILDEVELVDFLKIDISGNIYRFDTHEMEQRLMDLHGISHAKVEKQIPGTLLVEIQAREAISWVNYKTTAHTNSRVMGNYLVDASGTIFPCTQAQQIKNANLPIILLDPQQTTSLKAGQVINDASFQHSFQLLKTIYEIYPHGISTIDSLAKRNEWSIELVTKNGCKANFGLSDHKRQLEYLILALRHSESQGYQIATIDLIPKRNVPITIANLNVPKAIPVQETSSTHSVIERQTADIQNLLLRD